MAPVILTCAITGNLTRPDQTPHLPITPAQIAQSSIEAADAGAAIVHIHVRHPHDGSPSMEIAHYREVVARIRDARPDLILNLTTGPGGRFVPDADNPRLAGPGTTLLPPLERVAHIMELRPDICTLDLNTMNSGDQVVMNTRRTVTAMADAILAAGVKPEVELFNPGDAVLAAELLEGRMPSPPLYSLVTGVNYGFPATLESLLLGRSQLPAGAIWTGFGIGRHVFPMLAQSLLLGGQMRVGLEDGVYLSRGMLAPSNAALCSKARRIAEDLGFALADTATARRMLGLSPHAGTARL